MKPSLKLSFGPGRYRSRFCNDALLELVARPSTGRGNVNRVRHDPIVAQPKDL
jgi:hypothetical protein